MDFIFSLDEKKYPLSIPNFFSENFLINKIPTQYSYSTNNFLLPFNCSQVKIIYSSENPLPRSYVINMNHSTIVSPANKKIIPNADGQYLIHSKKDFANEQTVLSLKTADCLPVIFFYENDNVSFFSITHAGWRGLSGGIISNTFQILCTEAKNLGINKTDFCHKLKIFIAPAIFGKDYECAEDVSSAFENHINFLKKNIQLSKNNETLLNKLLNVKSNENKIDTQIENKIYPDLQLMCTIECSALGVKEENIVIHRENTFGHPVLFSYREAKQNNEDPKQRFWTNLIYN